MDSKYIPLIALVVAVFFAGIYMTSEAARKKEIKREMEVIENRQTEINSLVADIERVTAEKDQLLLVEIENAREDISLLERDEKATRERIDSLGERISAMNGRLSELAAEINAVPAFLINEPSIHSVEVDPDITMEDSLQFNPHEPSIGLPLIAPPPAPPPPAHLAVAKMFAEQGVKEIPPGSNRGPDVERFLASVGLKPYKDRDGNWKSYPYCAAFVSFCLNEAGNILLPRIRSAGSRKFITNNSINIGEAKTIPMRLAIRGTHPIQPGTLVIWARNARNPQDTRGHIGFVIDWEGQSGTTVEANTSSGRAGSQRDGDGVYIRQRMLQPANAFRITHFTPVRVRS